MDKTEFRQLIRECIVEVIKECATCGCGCPDCKHTKGDEGFKPIHGPVKEDNMKMKAPETPKVRKTWGNMNPTTRIHGDGKQGVKPKYDRKKDQGWKKDLDEGRKICAWCKKDLGDLPGVEGDSHGICPDCKEKHFGNLSKKVDTKPSATTPPTTNLKEMTTTGAVASYPSKNWVDPDPDRKKMKSIAAKSVGGKVA